MSVLRFFSPIRAWRDLRAFLSERQPHQLGFLALSFTITGFLIWAFVHDSHFERPYTREIIYVESWPADRSTEEILAAQVVDKANREKREAEVKALREKRQAEFKRLDEKLDSWGL